MPTTVTAAVASKLLQSPLKYILLDIDGVIWSGPTVINKVPETLEYLRAQGKHIRFLTNNATTSREGLVKTFSSRGIHGVKVEEIYNSGYAASLRLKERLGITSSSAQDESLVHGNVFVIGERGLHDELQKVLAPGYITYGLELHDMESIGGYNSHELAHAWTAPLLPAPEKQLVLCDGVKCRMVQAGKEGYDGKISLRDLNPIAVVVGLDLHYNMMKLAVASLVLNGPPPSLRAAEEEKARQQVAGGLSKEREGAKALHTSALFIATNEDPQIPVGHDCILLPGAGGMVSSVVTCSGRTPDAVCGKPNRDMADILFCEEHIENPKEMCLMIGDRLTTDVAFGNKAGCQSMLVLSGAEGLADVEKVVAEGDHSLIPDYVGDSLACFLP